MAELITRVYKRLLEITTNYSEVYVLVTWSLDTSVYRYYQWQQKLVQFRVAEALRCREDCFWCMISCIRSPHIVCYIGKWASPTLLLSLGITNFCSRESFPKP